jgi:hypothetical protein
MKKTYAAMGMTGLAFTLAGCVTNDVVSYKPSATQQPLTRDGVQALMSTQPKSAVMLRPAGRGVQPGARAVYVVAVQNRSSKPVEMRVADIKVVQTKAGQFARALPVKTYEQLVKEEKTAQVLGGIAVGLGAAANSYNAQNAGYGTAHGTARTYSPYGTYQTNVSMSYNDPVARQLAVNQANYQNQQNISNFAANSEANMMALEANVLKDNTVMPGEWIGGTVTFEAPRKEFAEGKAKSYSIAVQIGEETHIIEAVQAPPAKG